MMNFMMMTMGTQTSRARRLMNLLEKMTKMDHIYSDSQLHEMKQQLRVLKEELSNMEAKTSKGFGK